ncbi:MAG: GNAT family N-acetyltransferase [Deltaproteobacteria bacterium]|nr:GNAT family N-acetyltransferase [Deltaproteobacteria bacterium]
MRIRKLCSRDRTELVRLIRGTTEFTDAEKACAIELVDAALSDDAQTDYIFRITTDENDTALGYACYGPTPMTDATFDLYWIAVSSFRRGGGLGRGLLAGVEEELRMGGARHLIVETGSNPAYAKTRAFYDRAGYSVAARIPDYYKVGDDLIIYRKVLAQNENSGHL